jgi:hypothetical protein
MTDMPEPTVYTDADLVKFHPAFMEAMSLWSLRCAQYVAKHGDKGSCVIGAGIGVYYRGPRKRSYELKLVIDVPMTASQGSCTWEASVPEVIAFLKTRGIEAHHIYGRMD